MNSIHEILAECLRTAPENCYDAVGDEALIKRLPSSVTISSQQQKKDWHQLRTHAGRYRGPHFIKAIMAYAGCADEAQVNPNYTQECGMIALWHGVLGRNTCALPYLIDTFGKTNDAVNKPDSSGATILCDFILAIYDDCLQNLPRNPRDETVLDMLLCEAKCDPNLGCAPTNDRPLMHALATQQPWLVERLIQRGANVFVCNNRGINTVKMSQNYLTYIKKEGTADEQARAEAIAKLICEKRTGVFTAQRDISAPDITFNQKPVIKFKP